MKNKKRTQVRLCSCSCSLIGNTFLSSNGLSIKVLNYLLLFFSMEGVLHDGSCSSEKRGALRNHELLPMIDVDIKAQSSATNSTVNVAAHTDTGRTVTSGGSMDDWCLLSVSDKLEPSAFNNDCGRMW